MNLSIIICFTSGAICLKAINLRAKEGAASIEHELKERAWKTQALLK